MDEAVGTGSLNNCSYVHSDELGVEILHLDRLGGEGGRSWTLCVYVEDDREILMLQM
jgi:hypothetical protein